MKFNRLVQLAEENIFSDVPDEIKYDSEYIRLLFFDGNFSGGDIHKNYSQGNLVDFLIVVRGVRIKLLYDSDYNCAVMFNKSFIEGTVVMYISGNTPHYNEVREFIQNRTENEVVYKVFSDVKAKFYSGYHEWIYV